MEEPPRILIIGHGTLGGGMTKVLTDAGFPVTVYDKGGIAAFTQYDWMKPYPDQSNPAFMTGKTINCTGFDFVFLAVPMSALKAVIEGLRNLDPHTAVVPMQKGMLEDLTMRNLSPYHLVKSRQYKNPVLSFTGAGFGEHMAAGHIVRMIAGVVTHDIQSILAAKRLIQVFDDTNIKADISYLPEVMWAGGVCRTVYSLITAVVMDRLRNEEGTLASALGGIENEFWRAVAMLSHRDGPLSLDSVEHRTISADRMLCDFLPGSLSRNTELGKRLAKGENAKEAYYAVSQLYGVVEGYINAPLVFNLISSMVDEPTECEIRTKFPYLYALWSLMKGEFTLDRCEEFLRGARE